MGALMLLNEGVLGVAVLKAKSLAPAAAPLLVLAVTMAQPRLLLVRLENLQEALSLSLTALLLRTSLQAVLVLFPYPSALSISFLLVPVSAGPSSAREGGAREGCEGVPERIPFSPTTGPLFLKQVLLMHLDPLAREPQPSNPRWTVRTPAAF